MLAASLRYGVPAELIKAVCLAESGMNPNAVSKAGAQGLMQLMPDTAAELAVTDPFDPHQSIDGGARYLARQLKAFGSTRLALAAYNAGPHNVRKHGGVPPFEETQAYVSKVMALQDHFRYERPIAAPGAP
ncbi:MAG: lytic transglycosylase domain-containing protein [Alphaproteobacteria bacterium]|nr:lytic transglycosylase domain-containing protein [Alphaproteobacteria bacterium]